MTDSKHCQSFSPNFSLKGRSISLHDFNMKSSNLEFYENGGVEQNTVKSIKSKEKTKYSLWERILEEPENNMTFCKQWWEEKISQETKPCFQEGPGDYLNKNIFPLLLPAMKDMLIQAHQSNTLKIHKCRFNGIDFLAEKMWNTNPRHPERHVQWLDVLNIPIFKDFLKLHPRPIYPKSWIWTKDEAAIIIQKYIRGWLVRKSDNHEVAHFVKIIE